MCDVVKNEKWYEEDPGPRYANETKRRPKVAKGHRGPPVSGPECRLPRFQQRGRGNLMGRLLQQRGGRRAASQRQQPCSVEALLAAKRPERESELVRTLRATRSHHPPRASSSTSSDVLGPALRSRYRLQAPPSPSRLPVVGPLVGTQDALLLLGNWRLRLGAVWLADCRG